MGPPVMPPRAEEHLKNLVECSTANPVTDDVINLGAVGHAVRICLELVDRCSCRRGR